MPGSRVLSCPSGQQAISATTTSAIVLVAARCQGTCGEDEVRASVEEQDEEPRVGRGGSSELRRRLTPIKPLSRAPPGLPAPDAPRAPDAAEQVHETKRRCMHRGWRKHQVAEPPQRDLVPERPRPPTAESAHSPIGAAHARFMGPWRGMPFARWLLTPAVVRRQWRAHLAERFRIRETLGPLPVSRPLAGQRAKVIQSQWKMEEADRPTTKAMGQRRVHTAICTPSEELKLPLAAAQQHGEDDLPHDGSRFIDESLLTRSPSRSPRRQAVPEPKGPASSSAPPATLPPPPQPDYSVPVPYLEDREGWRYCLLCSRWADKGHISSEKHLKRAETPGRYLHADNGAPVRAAAIAVSSTQSSMNVKDGAASAGFSATGACLALTAPAQQARRPLEPPEAGRPSKAARMAGEMARRQWRADVAERFRIRETLGLLPVSRPLVGPRAKVIQGQWSTEEADPLITEAMGQRRVHTAIYTPSEELKLPLAAAQQHGEDDLPHDGPRFIHEVLLTRSPSRSPRRQAVQEPKGAASSSAPPATLPPPPQLDFPVPVPFLEDREGSWYCLLCSCWADKRHISSEKHSNLCGSSW